MSESVTGSVPLTIHASVTLWVSKSVFVYIYLFVYIHLSRGIYAMCCKEKQFLASSYLPHLNLHHPSHFGFKNSADAKIPLYLSTKYHSSDIYYQPSGYSPGILPLRKPMGSPLTPASSWTSPCFQLPTQISISHPFFPSNTQTRIQNISLKNCITGLQYIPVFPQSLISNHPLALKTSELLQNC